MPYARDALLTVAKSAFDAPAERLAMKGVSEDLLTSALVVWVRAGGAPVAARLQKEISVNQDPAQRRALYAALASVPDVAIATEVRAMTLKPDIQLRDLFTVLYVQADQKVLGDSYWDWYQANFATLLKRAPAMTQGSLVGLGARDRCDKADVAPLQRFITPRMSTIANGPRALKQATEEIGLCAALAKHHAGTKIAAPIP